MRAYEKNTVSAIAKPHKNTCKYIHAVKPTRNPCLIVFSLCVVWNYLTCKVENHHAVYKVKVLQGLTAMNFLTAKSFIQ